MNTIFSLMVAGLFTFWVWDLKHRIEQLRKDAPTSTPAAPAPHHVIHHARPVPVPEQKSVAVAVHHPAVQRTREGNIPVWTIE